MTTICAFTGRSVRFLTETNSDKRDIAITVDGRPAHQAVYYSPTVTKKSGTYMLVDGFQ